MKEDWGELHKRSQESVVGFLRTEVEIAHTFCTMSSTTQDPVQRERLRRSIGEVVATIHRFEDRIDGQTTRAELHREADKLSDFLESSASVPPNEPRRPQR